MTVAVAVAEGAVVGVGVWVGVGVGVSVPPEGAVALGVSQSAHDGVFVAARPAVGVPGGRIDVETNVGAGVPRVTSETISLTRQPSSAESPKAAPTPIRK